MLSIKTAAVVLSGVMASLGAAVRGCLALLLFAITPSMQAAELGSGFLLLQPPFIVQSTDPFVTLIFNVKIGGYDVFSTNRVVALDPTATFNFITSSMNPSPAPADAGNTTSFSSIAGLLTNGVNDSIEITEVLWLGSTGFTNIASTNEFALFGHDFAGSTISDIQLINTTPVSSDGASFAVFGSVTLVVDGIAAAPVPEPETYAMLLAGLAMLGFATRRRKQKEAALA